MQHYIYMYIYLLFYLQITIIDPYFSLAPTSTRAIVWLPQCRWFNITDMCKINRVFPQQKQNNALRVHNSWGWLYIHIYSINLCDHIKKFQKHKIIFACRAKRLLKFAYDTRCMRSCKPIVINFKLRNLSSHFFYIFLTVTMTPAYRVI